MNDEKFLGKLEKMREERLDLMQARAKLVDKMKTMVDAKRAELPGADDAAVKAALERDPEWVSLRRRCEDMNAVIAEANRRSMKTVRERLAPQKPVEKTISK